LAPNTAFAFFYQFFTQLTSKGALEDYYAAQTAAEPPADTAHFHDDLEDLDQDYNDDQIEAALMSDQDPPSQPAAGAGAGPRTLGGQSAADPLPAGWGVPERRTGRIGEWGSGAQARRPGE